MTVESGITDVVLGAHALDGVLDRAATYNADGRLPDDAFAFLTTNVRLVQDLCAQYVAGDRSVETNLRAVMALLLAYVETD